MQEENKFSYRSLNQSKEKEWHFARGLNDITTAGNYAVRLYHDDLEAIGISTAECDTEHYVVAHLVVIESAATGKQQKMRTIGQTLMFTTCTNQSMKIITRICVLTPDGVVWHPWVDSKAGTDYLPTAQELNTTAGHLDNKFVYKGTDDVDIVSGGYFDKTVNDITLNLKKWGDTTGLGRARHTIAAATEATAGVMSAEDKKKLNKAEVVTKVEWGVNSNINDYTSAGVYYITGKRSMSDDGLPIDNYPYFTAKLLVVGSTANNNSITQILSLNASGESNLFMRTCVLGDTTVWGKWSMLQQNTNVGRVASLDNFTAGGVYSGIYTGGTLHETFVLTVINNEAAATAAGSVRCISQFKYALDLDSNYSYKTRTGRGTEEIEWGDWAEVGAPGTVNIQDGAVTEQKLSSDVKVKVNSSFDYVNTIEDKHFDVSSLSVGNANTRDVGTTVSFGKLEDWRFGTFRCKAGQLIKIDTQGGLEAARPFAFCDKDLVILQSFGYDVGDGINKGAYVAPEGTEYIVVNCTADYADKFLLEVWGKQTVPSSIDDRSYTASSLWVGNANTRDVGTTVSFGKLEDWRVGTYRCKAGQLIKINTQGGIGGARPFAFCDKNLTILQTSGKDTGDGMLNGEFRAPEGTEYIVVNCIDEYAGSFSLEIMGSVVYEMQNMDVAPQIYEQPIRRRGKDEPVRLCFFGNSWHMNTWWYLNKMLHSAGINAEMKCFYIGGSIFNKWVDNYKNNTAVDCWLSVNGSNWEHDTLNFADTLKEKWDVIAFQQGAYRALDWNNWSIYNELISIIKRNCEVDTVIAFNVGWTPALQNENLAVYGNTVEGQRIWQEIDNRYTLRFMKMSGISNVAPNGATMWSMRRNPKLNVANDMATDALHPDNGLPMYGLAGTWWQTYIAPMFGVDFNEVEWMPTESSQKAEWVSGTTWQPISEEQRELIREIVKLSMSNRFGFNEI